MKIIGREDIKPSNRRLFRICDVHFTEEQIWPSSQRRGLRKEAVPTLFLPMRKPSTKRKRVDKGTQLSKITDNSSSQTESHVFELMHEIEKPYYSHMTYVEAEQMAAKSKYFNLCDRLLSEDLSKIAKAGVNVTNNDKDKYTVPYKLFCLKLYYCNPLSYHTLHKSLDLPSIYMLNKLYVPTCTKINDISMAALQVKIEQMDNAEKYCTVMVNRMNLKMNLYYDINKDRIIGFHEVNGVQSPVPAKYAIIVVLRGIFVKWSLPIGYALVAYSYKSVAKWIDKLVFKLLEIGFKIKAFVSDLRLDLFNAAKERGVSADTPYFTIGTNKIYYIFDAPCLIKSIRNYFMRYDFHYQNGVAKFEHVVKFYEYDVQRTLRKAPKLSNSHIYPTKQDQTRIRFATQLLSKSVAAGIYAYVDFQLLDKSASDTAKFINAMNDLFDVLNSSNAHHMDLFKRAFNGRKIQTNVLNETLNILQSLKLYNSATGKYITKTPTFVTSLQITIQSIIALQKDLRLNGYDNIPTRRLNLGITTTIIRKIRTANPRPTGRQFVAAFGRLQFARIIQPPKECKKIPDFTKFLAELMNYDNSIAKEQRTNPESHNSMRSILRSDYTEFDMEDKPMVYICAALMTKCLNVHDNCNELQKYFIMYQRQVRAKNMYHSYNFRDFASYNYVPLVPPPGFMKNIDVMEYVFNENFDVTKVDTQIGEHVYQHMKRSQFFMLCSCFPKNYLRKLYIRMKIFLTMKSNNRKLRKIRDRRKQFTVTCL
jgi:hypothetical protein